jgi:flagellar hook-associated protein 1 FlgK
VASLNRALSGVDPGSGESIQIRDELAVAVQQLSGLAQINAVQRGDGGFDIELANGGALVIGDRSYALTTVNRAVTGVADVTLGGVTITTKLRSGTLGGLLDARDTLIPGYQAQLDDLAYAVTQEVNAVHRQGYDANGAQGGDFFAPLATVSGAARAISIDAALTSAGGTSLVAASATGAPGDNGNARALAALRDAKVMDGNTTTFGGAWEQLVYGVGSDSAAAQASYETHSEIVAQIQNLQDGVSGISLDEEAADMLRFQRAYEANARFFRTINDTLDILFRTFGN